MKESKVELDSKKLAQHLGWNAHKLTDSKGVPDKCFIKQGRVFYVEFKRPKGGVIAPAQLAWRDKALDNGTPHYFCHTLQKFQAVLLEREREWFAN